MSRFRRTMSDSSSALDRLLGRRNFVTKAVAGSSIAVLGGLYVFTDDRLTRAAAAQTRPDGKPRLPPGQRVIEALKPMGGAPGRANPAKFRLQIHGEVERPFVLDFAGLLALPALEQRADVHCVTGWSVLGARWKGISMRELATRARVKGSARHVIFEAAHGYTANVPLAEALGADSMVTWQLDGKPLARPHGSPVRALVPSLYFWKSAKWLQGIRFVNRDDPGYWETRGYHNHADPWREERYA